MANPRGLSKDFEKVFNDGKFSDIKLSVNGKVYPAHKFILAARSDVFAAMLLEQGKEEVIEIEDVTAEIMEEMLRYIYTEKVKRIDQLATDLLIAAGKFGLEELKTICGKALFKTVSISNALDMLKIASKHNAEELKRDVIRFIGANKFELMKTKAWQELQSDELNFQMIKELYEAYGQVEVVSSASIASNVSQSGIATANNLINSQNVNAASQCLIKPQPVTLASQISARVTEPKGLHVIIRSLMAARNNPYSKPQ